MTEFEKVEKLNTLTKSISEKIIECCELLDIKTDWESNPQRPDIYDPVLSKAKTLLERIWEASIPLRRKVTILSTPSGYIEYPYKDIEGGYYMLYDGVNFQRSKAEHRYVIEKDIGRELETKEHVHHIDENKLNNCLSNLQVVSPSEHRKIHAQKRRGV